MILCTIYLDKLESNFYFLIFSKGKLNKLGGSLSHDHQKTNDGPDANPDWIIFGIQKKIPSNIENLNEKNNWQSAAFIIIMILLVQFDILWWIIQINKKNIFTSLRKPMMVLTHELDFEYKKIPSYIENLKIWK